MGAVTVTALCAALLLGLVQVASAADQSALLASLRHGGYVILMRHASSPRTPPDKGSANPDNTVPERQLDEAGRHSAKAMGEAFRTLMIPIGVVLCSPTYRARETLRWAGLAPTRIDAELGDGGQSMAGITALQAAWLRQQVSEFPEGSNTLIVTHYPNIAAAFASEAAGLEDGEALIIGPDGHGGTVVHARIRIEEWPRLGP